ncbi:MAG: alpha/beta hydrolase [Cyanobacteria bacterium J06638_28]
MLPRVSTTGTPDVLWLSVNPNFRRLEQPLLVQLTEHHTVSHWSYCQTPDEPCSLDIALTLLHDSLKAYDRALHIIGHGTGGVLGILYARQFPRRVKSLTLLGVGANPAVDWKAHYYTQLEQLSCSRSCVLTQMVHSLFGKQCNHCLQGLRELLERDLMESLSLHSLAKRFSLFPGNVPVPLLVCGGQEDAIVDSVQLQSWQPWLKDGDRLWLCPDGRHFFHATHPARSSEQILDFWHQVESTASFPACLES